MIRLLKHVLFASMLSLPISAMASPLLQVDIGLSGQDIQLGFSELSGAAGTGSASAGFGGITVAVSAEGTQGFRDRGSVDHDPFGKLAEDFVFGTRSVLLELTGLVAGVYNLTTWHHDADFVQSTFKIQVNGFDLLTGIASTTGLTPTAVTSAFVQFVSDGIGTDQIRFIETANGIRPNDSNADTAVIFNGFVLHRVPEPSALALLAIGLIGAAGTLKRKAL